MYKNTYINFVKMRALKHIAIVVAVVMSAAIFNPGKVTAQDVTWKLNNLETIGGVKPEVLGKPVIKTDSGYQAIAFNGVNDGLVLPNMPMEGWKQFTIEVLFKPDGDGPIAPRFVHFLDKDQNRGTFEIRLTKDKKWYMDTFLKNGKVTDKGLTLIDSTLLHPADRWYWVAMTFDGKAMISYVNGVKEKEGLSNFPRLGAAQVSLGVRLNKVAWFKGMISEIRFHPMALSADALQKLKE